MQKTLISWNVNGIRAAEKKGFLPWLGATNYDIVSVQETKVSPETKLSAELKAPAGYRSYWDYSTDKKGYSGVASYCKTDFIPTKINTVFPHEILTKEGRLLELEYPDFTLFNIYFPNGKKDQVRLDYKLKFYDEFLKHITALKKQGKKVIFCGDVNTAHTEIDLARPKENSKISGFLEIERKWIDEVIKVGFVDTLRLFTKEGGHYSWWDQFTHARERNVGWRIDYFFVDEAFAPKVKDAFILDDVLGSDHAPVGIKIEL